MCLTFNIYSFNMLFSNTKFSRLIIWNPYSLIISNHQWKLSTTTITSTSYCLLVMYYYYTYLFKYPEFYDLLFCFIILLKCLISMLFINILLLFLYEVNSYEFTRVESMKLSRVCINSRAKFDNLGVNYQGFVCVCMLRSFFILILLFTKRKWSGWIQN